VNGSTDFWRVSHYSQLSIISKLAEGAFYSFIQVIYENVKQNWTQYQPVGDSTSYSPPIRLCASDQNPLSSAGQPVLHPPHCRLICPTLRRLTYEDVMKDSVKSLAEVKLHHWSPLTYAAGHGIIEG